MIQTQRNSESQQVAVGLRLICFDPDSIDWGNYFMNTHIPGVQNLLQRKWSFPTTKVFRSTHLPSSKIINATVLPTTLIETSRMGKTHFPDSHREKTYFQLQLLSKITLNVLGNKTGAAPLYHWKPMSGMYAL